MKRLFCYVTFAVMILIPALVFSLRAKTPWLDESQQAFLTGELAEELSSYRNFPVFWWNFLVLPNADKAEALKLCRDLLKANDTRVRALPCAKDLARLRPWLESWVKDASLRKPFPPRALAREQIETTLAKAALPIGHEAIEILRLDPFNEINELETLGKEKIQLPFEHQDGLFFDNGSKQILIPIQFSFPPTDTEQTESFAATLGSKADLLGPHQATFENESTVRHDVEVVSIVGGILMTLIFTGLLILKRTRILVFIPPLALSTLTALALTVGAFGKIHGMVLAFGPGIIGLSMDYAIHAAFATGRIRETWLANFLGVLTTMTVILVGLTSELPILRQLMVFSGTGLLIGFFAFYVLHLAHPMLFQVKSFLPDLPLKRTLGWSTLGLVFFALVGSLRAVPGFQMADLNYETERTAQLNRWLSTAAKLKAPYLQVERASGTFLESAHEASTWAKSFGLRHESVASFLPRASEQKIHQQEWHVSICGEAPFSLPFFSENETEFFAPFLVVNSCTSRSGLRSLGENQTPPKYLEDLYDRGSWVTLWFPETAKQVDLLKSKFKNVTSIGEAVAVFPLILKRELYWMAPITFLLSTILLFVYYRQIRFTFAALLPFICGLGAYFAIDLIFPMTLSFITLVGFIMVFGFSLDYGIFAADGEKHGEDHKREVRSALTLTSLMTLAGFVPLLFARHPAMKHLGQALVLGSIGTYLGALWGVGPWLKLAGTRIGRKEKR